MKQPPKIQTSSKKISEKKKNFKKGGSINGKKRNKKHPQYGTSKLEEKFAKEFLDKLGLKYIYQFEAKDIKRFYDYYLPDENLLIEVDGQYYHGFGLVHEEKNPMQKHNEWVDKIKDEWAAWHCIPLLRIWEKDINENPSKVIKMLKESCSEARKKIEINKNRKKGLKWTEK